MAAQPTLIVVDWCVLKADESLHLLRAALPVGGRALPVWDEVHGQPQLGNGAVHTAFLARLRRLLPVDTLVNFQRAATPQPQRHQHAVPLRHPRTRAGAPRVQA